MSTVHYFKRFKNLGNLHAQGTSPKNYWMPVIIGPTGSTALKQESFCHGNHRLLTQFTVLSTKVKKKPCEHDPETLPSSLGLSSSKTYWGKVENWSEIRRIGNWNSFWKTMEKRSCPSCWQQSVQKHLWWYGYIWRTYLERHRRHWKLPESNIRHDWDIIPLSSDKHGIVPTFYRHIAAITLNFSF